MRRILLLEDDEAIRRHLCEIIEELHKNVEICCAANIKDAYNLAMEYQIHLFLIDIILDTVNPGDVSGLRFIQEMRGVKRYEYVPVIFITAMQDPELYSYSQLKCFDFIEKPFDEERVKKNIIKALGFPLASEQERYVYFRKDRITYAIRTDEIYYIDIHRRNITVYSVNGKLEMPYKTCREIVKELGTEGFIQCSRYKIINRRWIEHIDYARRYVKLRNVEEYIEIGVAIKNKFKDEMDEWKL